MKVVSQEIPQVTQLVTKTRWGWIFRLFIGHMKKLAYEYREWDWNPEMMFHLFSEKEGDRPSRSVSSNLPKLPPFTF